MQTMTVTRRQFGADPMAATTTTTFEHKPDRRPAGGKGGGQLTISERGDGTSMIVFGPLIKWGAGILSALIVSGVVSLIVMGRDNAVMRSEMTHMRDDVATLKATILDGVKERYTSSQASNDRQGMMTLIGTNAQDISTMNQMLSNIRERISTIEAELKASNGKDR